MGKSYLRCSYINGVIPEGLFAINVDDRRMGTVALPLLTRYCLFVSARRGFFESRGIGAFGLLNIHTTVGLTASKE